MCESYIRCTFCSKDPPKQSQQIEARHASLVVLAGTVGKRCYAGRGRKSRQVGYLVGMHTSKATSIAVPWLTNVSCKGEDELPFVQLQSSQQSFLLQPHDGIDRVNHSSIKLSNKLVPTLGDSGSSTIKCCVNGSISSDLIRMDTFERSSNLGQSCCVQPRMESAAWKRCTSYHCGNQYCRRKQADAVEA